MTTDETRYRIDYTHKQRLTHLYRKPANSSSPTDPFFRSNGHGPDLFPRPTDSCFLRSWWCTHCTTLTPHATTHKLQGPLLHRRLYAHGRPESKIIRATWLLARTLPHLHFSFLLRRATTTSTIAMASNVVPRGENLCLGNCVFRPNQRAPGANSLHFAPSQI